MLKLDYISCFLTVLSTVLVGKKLWQGWLVAGVKQHRHLCHRNANGGIWISSRQSFLHRTLCKQRVEWEAEGTHCRRSIPPAIPRQIVSAFQRFVNKNSTKTERR